MIKKLKDKVNDLEGKVITRDMARMMVASPILIASLMIVAIVMMIASFELGQMSMITY